MTENTSPGKGLDWRPSTEREAALMQALPGLVRAAQQLPAMGERLHGVEDFDE